MARALRLAITGGALFGAVVLSLAAFEADAESIEAMRARANAGTVGIVSGGVDGTYVRIAADLASVLDDGDNLRVLPLIGKGSVRNLADVMFVRGIDIGIVQSDVLAYVKRERLYPGVEKSINYVAKLYDEELHLLAREDIQSIDELAGKKVNVDLRGSGTAITSSLVFERIGVAVEPTNFDQALALEKLRRGEIAALAFVAGKPARLFRDLTAADRLHFLTVPATAALLETYLPAQLTAEDYAAIVPADGPVDTVAVGAVMAVYNWAPETERYRKVAQFVDALFDKFDGFLQPPRHAKWAEVNLAAEVPGWTRFGPAERRLRQDRAPLSGSSSQGSRVSAAAHTWGRSDRSMSEAVKTSIFDEFLRWQDARKAQRLPDR